MAACPNCGRQTLRTKDWACQWCGYPLLSRAYKKIDKTFKELQEERSSTLRTASPVPEPEPETSFDSDLELEFKPEPAPGPDVALEPPPDIKQKRRLAPKIEPKPEEKHEPKVGLEPPPELKQSPPPVPEPAPEPELEPESEPALPAQITTPQPAPQLAAGPAPEPLPESEPAPVAAPNLDTITDGTVLSVDDLDALFKANRLGAHAKLTNKTVVITGFVEKVFIRDHIDVRYIVLTGARKKVLWPVRCTFVKESMPQMKSLSEGQEVTMRGKYDSYGKNIIFKECVLVG